MNIVIFEMEHFETAYTLIRLFDMPGNQITIYTNESCNSKFHEFFGNEYRHCSWAVQLPQETNRQVILRMFRSFRSSAPDLLFYGTISNNHLLHALMIRRSAPLRTILTLHDINSMFDFPFRPRIKIIARYLGKKALIKYIREFNVIVETMTGYLRNRLPQNKIVHTVPGAVFEHDAPRLIISGPIRMVIPGTIDKSRRDYKQVFELLNLAERIDLPIEAVLLGEAFGEYGKEIIQQAKNWPRGCTSVKYYLSTVDQAEFDREMRSAQVALIPSVVESISPYGVKEIYGATKSSGSIGDVIRHARPFILPERLALPEAMEAGSFRYEKLEDIIDLLKSLHRNPIEYESWQEKALQCSQHYTIENVRKGNPGLFEQQRLHEGV
ncbi:MAG: hypothetical protein ABI687_02010 [Flavitalea sp.]